MKQVGRGIWLLAMLVPALSACGASSPPASAPKHLKPVSLMLDWYPNSDHAGLYSAIDKGYYRSAGLQVKPVVPSDPTAALKLVADGKEDFAISYEPDTLIARSQGLPVVAVMSLVTRPLDSIIALKSSGIRSPKDLIGKKVGMAGLPSDTAFLKAVLNHEGDHLSQVTKVNVGYNLVPALLSHKVDAIIGGYWNWEAVQIRQMGHPDVTFRLDNYGVPRYDELVVVTSQAMIQKHPRLVKAFVQATQHGLSYASAHPHTAASFIVKAGKGLKPKLVNTSVGLLKGVFEQNNVPGYVNAKAWQTFANWMRTSKLLAKPVQASKAVTSRFLKP